ncbi:hypothetical protein Btru_026361 [Bulinus truncatus]|nr:hypothetical protein Btru_026361 [Bulinus truncatus]
MRTGAETKTKWPEMNAIAAGIFGLIGVGMYGVLIIEIARGGDGSVHWAFPVTTVSVTGFIVCGILMAIANPIHTQTQSYPGQIMSLSRQNSLRLREPSMQDRLVVLNDSSGQPSGVQTPSTLYGITGVNSDARESNFLPRSESCLSSHMSSPDLFTASSPPLGLPHGQTGTHVVLTHDTYVTGYDAARRQTVKQQIQNKAAQRRSWHFDDRSGAYIVSDLINARSVGAAPTDDEKGGGGGRPQEVVKPPVPPRRDKMQAPNPNKPLSKNRKLQAIPDENMDLMVLDDPEVKSPISSDQERNSSRPAEGKPPEVIKNTNPFIDEPQDLARNNAANLDVAQENFVRQDSWENQPWPDPPSETEILEQIASGDGSVSQSNNVPESLQYQPQNYASLTRKQVQESAVKISVPEGSESVAPKHIAITSRHMIKQADRHTKRKPNMKHPPPLPESQVPVLKEYDNPLFKSPTPEDKRANTFNEEFTLTVCDSTSFINPSPQPPPDYYSVVNSMQSEPSSYRRHSSHYNYSPKLDNREGGVQLTKRPVSFENGHDAIPGHAGQSNKHQGEAVKKQSKVKAKSKSQQNGAVKSRPRQVKREHNQRRTGHSDAANTLQHQKPPPSVQGGSTCYGSSPDLVIRSPKAGRRGMLTNTLPANRTDYEDSNRNISSRANSAADYVPSTYGYDSNRQSPYYASGPVNQYHLGDSDL